MGGKKPDFDAIAAGENQEFDAAADDDVDDQPALVERSGPVAEVELQQRRDYQTELSSKHHRWKLGWFWVRHPIAVGVGLVWLGLTVLVGKEIWQLLIHGFDTEPYALAGIFAAWLGLTATIHKTLSPEQPTKSVPRADILRSLPSGDQG